MTQATAIKVGSFCWHELNTRGVDKAKKFYNELCGWTTEANDMGKFTYHAIRNKAGKGFGGMMDTSSPEWGDIPPHWMTYIYCDDVDASTEKATKLGAEVCVPPTDIPNTGRFSVITDPTGATFSLFTSNEPYELADVVAWNELMTRDVPGARKFYTEMFGYGVDDMPMGDQGVYTIFKIGDDGVAGGMDISDARFEGVPAHWMPYIGTDNVDNIAKRTTELGGEVIHPPTDIPNIGRFCIIKDPTGAPISFYQSTKG